MNWEHFRAFLWLRWRLRSNQRRRLGSIHAFVDSILTILAASAAVIALGGGLLAGLFGLGKVSPGTLLLVWDGVVVAFLFMSATELLVELQRSEMLSMERFLHLPVSLMSVFVINYAGSMFSFAGIIFLPGMLGMAIGLAISRGPSMILLVPLVGALVLAFTALTYQFRGWLASMMFNQRRRRTIIAMATVVFMLVTQLPNVWNLNRSRPDRSVAAQVRKDRAELERARAAGEISAVDYAERRRALSPDRGVSEETIRLAQMGSLAIPFGWLPYGAMSIAEGSALPALLGTLGLALIGVVSLRRSYRTTLRIYTGDFGRTKARARPVMTPLAAPRVPGSLTLMEKSIPWVSAEVSTVAIAGFRSLLRAPEAKMMLMSPVILLVLFGSMFRRMGTNPSEFLLPLMAAGSITMLFFTTMGIAGNQFGFDRSGFRVFVLAPARRVDILLGKNLSLAPFVLGLALGLIAFFQFMYPMRADHLLALTLQLLPMYLVYSLVANFLSILAPFPIKQGTLKPANPKGMAILIHLGFFLLFPVAMASTLIPLGLEFLLSWAKLYTWFPAYLVMTLAQVAIALPLYRVVLKWQGELLQSREQRILSVVTSHVE